jgi:hypothetical protein
VKTTKNIQVFNNMTQFYHCFILELHFHHGPNYKIVTKNQSFKVDSQMLTGMGGNHAMVCGCINPDYTKVGFEVSCPH